jgi:hypothetical protein
MIVAKAVVSNTNVVESMPYLLAKGVKLIRIAKARNAQDGLLRSVLIQ